MKETAENVVSKVEQPPVCSRGHLLTPDNVYETPRVGTFKTSVHRSCRRCTIERVKERRDRLSATDPGYRSRQREAVRTSRRRLVAEVRQVREEIKARRAAERAAARLARQEADLIQKAAAKRPPNATRRSDPARNWRDHLKNKYGLTVADYDQLLAAQAGSCAVCSTPLVRGNPNADNAPHVDHCHATKKIRGILCRLCNIAVGCLRDDPDRARSAAAYLERSR